MCFAPQNTGWTIPQCDMANAAYAILNAERPDLTRRNAEMITDAMANLISGNYWQTGVIKTPAEFIDLARLDAAYAQHSFLWGATRQ